LVVQANELYLYGCESTLLLDDGFWLLSSVQLPIYLILTTYFIPIVAIKCSPACLGLQYQKWFPNNSIQRNSRHLYRGHNHLSIGNILPKTTQHNNFITDNFLLDNRNLGSVFT
jgi:hypothetical protein